MLTLYSAAQRVLTDSSWIQSGRTKGNEELVMNYDCLRIGSGHDWRFAMLACTDLRYSLQEGSMGGSNAFVGEKEEEEGM